MTEEVFDCPICYGEQPFYYRGDDNCHLTIDDGDGPVVWEGDDMCLDCWCIRLDDQKLVHLPKLERVACLLMRGWKNTEVARLLGVHRNTVGNWKRMLGKNPEIFQNSLCILRELGWVPGSGGVFCAPK